MLTDKEKSTIELLLSDLDKKGTVENHNDKTRISIYFINKASLRTLATFDFNTKEELDQFIEPLKLIRQINANSEEKVTISLKSGLYQNGRYELSFQMGGNELSVNELRRLNMNLLNNANKEIQEKIHEIESLSQNIIDLIRSYNDIKENYNNIAEQVIKRQTNFMALLKRIDIRQNLTPYKVNETVQFDMSSILELYTRNEFKRFGDDKETVLAEEEKIYSELQKILSTSFNGKNFHINLSEYQEYELEKVKIITDILTESFTKYYKDINEKVENAKRKLDELIKHIEEKKPVKTLIVSKNDIESLEEPQIIKKYLTVTMFSKTDEKVSEISLNTEYKTAVLYDSMRDIEKKQNEELTPEERTGILIYKTQLYRAINPITSYIRSNNISYDDMFNDEFISNIIKTAYEEMVQSSGDEIEYKPTGIKEIDNIFDRYEDNLGIPPIEDYQKIVLESIPLIESALNKISIDEDMILYRGIPSNNNTFMNLPNHYLSTSMSPRVALDFLERETNQKGDIKTFYKITLPAGSHALFYTYELLTGEFSSDELYPLYGDEQKEVLIDTSMFDFEELKRSYFYGYDNIGGYQTDDMPIEYIEIVAHPKTIEYKSTLN